MISYWNRVRELMDIISVVGFCNSRDFIGWKFTGNKKRWATTHATTWAENIWSVRQSGMERNFFLTINLKTNSALLIISGVIKVAKED